ncbi:protein sneaky-like [Zerene cesonia]|uniref:protein sneaky-like n=1 Tax=Zerene cesonia TaxID=33412 RepID=UPI0018E59EB1|nr:protein sneaky-like [Zerene cesonia]
MTFTYLERKIVDCTISVTFLLGLGNAFSIQVRSITLLLLPMYCGKAGRGILKAVVLTYVVAGPITNMALNAKEVVRVFACSNQLSFNLTKLKYSFIASPVKRALLSMKTEIGEFKGTLRSIKTVVGPIEIELENTYEILKIRPASDLVDDMFAFKHHSDYLEEKYKLVLKLLFRAKETSLKVLHAFEEKYNIVKIVVLGVHVCLALLFLRLLISAQSYHDLYLTSINYDNVYITCYFKRIDQRRRRKLQCTLLPLKKMERNRYIDVYSTSYIPSERSKLFTQVLKVMLEAITATTFVMLDRLFYEALDVVRQYAIDNDPINGLGDLEIEVEGAGFVADMLRKMVQELNAINVTISITNEGCLPQPRAIPAIFYVKIYGGYLWILLLLFMNPYTLRLRRLICSYFYPQREKQRILHLYNDILKKRLKMQKTLRRKAVQAVRAHYLSGENLLSLRMKFPRILGWLGALPHARMKCLICEETEPWHRLQNRHNESWHSCENVKCPFLYCDECWKDIGSSCLACDPALNELSDVDSLSDDRPPRY